MPQTLADVVGCQDNGNNFYRTCEGIDNPHCKETIKNTGKDNGGGHGCHFPMKYNGKTYNSCTDDGCGFMCGYAKWCYTSDKSTAWGKCTEKCINPPMTKTPTKAPTKHPTSHPTSPPTKNPTKQPTNHPTKEPTHVPVATWTPTQSPTAKPTTVEETHLSLDSNCDSDREDLNRDAGLCFPNRRSLMSPQVPDPN